MPLTEYGGLLLHSIRSEGHFACSRRQDWNKSGSILQAASREGGKATGSASGSLKQRKGKSMTMTLGKKMKTLSATRRKRVEARAEALIAEEMSIRELRRARKLTQARMAKALNIGQESVSRLEKRTDLHISTLRHYVEAMGGKLSLVAEFPDREPVVLSGITSLDEERVSSNS